MDAASAASRLRGRTRSSASTTGSSRSTSSTPISRRRATLGGLAASGKVAYRSSAPLPDGVAIFHSLSALDPGVRPSTIWPFAESDLRQSAMVYDVIPAPRPRGRARRPGRPPPLPPHARGVALGRRGDDERRDGRPGPRIGRRRAAVGDHGDRCSARSPLRPGRRSTSPPPLSSRRRSAAPSGSSTSRPARIRGRTTSASSPRSRPSPLLSVMAVSSSSPERSTTRPRSTTRRSPTASVRPGRSSSRGTSPTISSSSASKGPSSSASRPSPRGSASP